MTDDETRTYRLEYSAGTVRPFFIDLCPNHALERLANGASILEKRIPVSKAICADCMPRESLRT